MDEATPTPWGYSVELGGEPMPPLITPERLSELTGGRFGPSAKGASAALDAVSAAVRAACGWHVSPPLVCVERTQGPGRVIALKTLMMGGVLSVEEDGQKLADGDFEWMERGLLRRACFREWTRRWGGVAVRYESGIPAGMAGALEAVCSQVAANALAAPAGVSSEQSGGVSISYNQTAQGVSGGIRLLDSDLAMLAPYMLGEVVS